MHALGQWDVRRFGDRQYAPNVVGRRRDLIFWSSALTRGRRHWNLGWLPYRAGDLVCLTTASGLLPADYCQRMRTELLWKCDIWFGDKALGLKETVTDVIHYCHLGKMAVVKG